MKRVILKRVVASCPLIVARVPLSRDSFDEVADTLERFAVVVGANEVVSATLRSLLDPRKCRLRQERQLSTAIRGEREYHADDDDVSWAEMQRQQQRRQQEQQCDGNGHLPDRSRREDETEWTPRQKMLAIAVIAAMCTIVSFVRWLNGDTERVYRRTGRR